MSAIIKWNEFNKLLRSVPAIQTTKPVTVITTNFTIEPIKLQIHSSSNGKKSKTPNIEEITINKDLNENIEHIQESREFILYDSNKNEVRIRLLKLTPIAI